MAAEGTDILGNIVESCLINEENSSTSVIKIDPDCVKLKSLSGETINSGKKLPISNVN